MQGLTLAYQEILSKLKLKIDILNQLADEDARIYVRWFYVLTVMMEIFLYL